MAKVSSLDLDRFVTGGDRSYIATWKFSKTHLDHYSVVFQYYVPTSDVKKNSKGQLVREWVWVNGSETTTKSKQATYTAPENASKIRVRVKPVSTKTKKVKKKTTYWWTGAWSSYKTATVGDAYVPDKPSTPTVTISGNYITAEVTNLDNTTDVDTVQFQFIINNSSSKTYTVKALYGSASYKLAGSSGNKYRVRARADNIVTKTVGKKSVTYQYWSEWSEYSNDYETQPLAPTDFKCSVKSETSVQLSWTKPSTADHYEIHYANTIDELDTQSGSSFKTATTSTNTSGHIISDLETGKIWYFRVRAINSSNVESSWSTTINVILGTKPSAPTTWSSVTTASLGDIVKLYWVHNSEDGSDQVKANIEITVDGVVTLNTEVDNPKDEYGEYSDETSVYELDTSGYDDSNELIWRVRTMGVTGEYGDWSVKRSINVYEKPSLYIDIVDDTGTSISTINSFPLNIKCSALPTTQTPIGYSISIIATESYETTEDVGTIANINEGDEVYNTFVDGQPGDLELSLSAGDVNLQNGITYQIIGTVSLDSGLTADGETNFIVEFADETFDIDAVINYNQDDLTAYIIPYCTAIVDDPTIDNTYDDLNEDETYPEETSLTSGVTMSVYRREANGKFTEIATGIDNSGSSTVTDPHPSLDYARYRIVARSEATGSISYVDLPGFPTGETSIVIQWSEEWLDYDFDANDYDNQDRSWTGSMLKLPYNIDVSESNSMDVSLVKYIGRERPVSYYGTQLGENPTWSCEIPKEDEETIYQLRRLAVYTGDVYVREPSGTGFWAQIDVSFNMKYNSLTVPVTLNVKPVEGGI